MKRMWSPWRMKYIEQPGESNGCFFCEAVANPQDPQHLVVHDGSRAFVIVNRYPYASGHIMVVPKEHIPSLAGMEPDVLQEVIGLLAKAQSVLQAVYQPEGFNIGANLGAAAGAGVPGHFHFHIVPRWVGDTNFMSTLGETRVLPEEVSETHRRLQQAWHS